MSLPKVDAEYRSAIFASTYKVKASAAARMMHIMKQPISPAFDTSTHSARKHGTESSSQGLILHGLVSPTALSILQASIMNPGSLLMGDFLSML